MAGPHRSLARMGALLVALTLWPVNVVGTETIFVQEASRYIGTRGKVESTRICPRGCRAAHLPQPPFPDHVFTVVIWREDRNEFVEQPKMAFFIEKQICVSGKIGEYDGKLQQVVVEDPKVLSVMPEETVVEEAGGPSVPEAAALPTRPSPPPPSCIPGSRCCRICTTGGACGNTCISRSYTCRKVRGCAWNSWEVCR